jgi:hypothetical protein
MKDQLRVAVIGASGYTGGELLRLLSLHPQVKIGQVVASGRSEGLSVSSLLPNLAHTIDCQLSPLDIPTIAKEVDLVFLALPHTQSLQPVGIKRPIRILIYYKRPHMDYPNYTALKFARVGWSPCLAVTRLSAFCN